jgi:hypothetical protein
MKRILQKIYFVCKPKRYPALITVTRDVTESDCRQNHMPEEKILRLAYARAIIATECSH